MQLYGLDLTKNSKVGWAFSVARKYSCIGKTDVCSRLCYANGVRYSSPAQKAKRERNYGTAAYLLEQGGAELLAENLVALIDQARPIDWLPAKLSGAKTQLPWSVRLHDAGDFWDPGYVHAWKIAAEIRPECSFWFYTRSFCNSKMLEALTDLAALANCQGWLSADSENYVEALRAYDFAPHVWKVSLLQEAPEHMGFDVIDSIRQTVREGQIVNFPYHRAGRHVEPLPDFFVCPQVLGVYPLQTSSEALKPCQQCSFCLP